MNIEWNEAHPGQWHASCVVLGKYRPVMSVMRRVGSQWTAVLVAPCGHMMVARHATSDVRAAQILVSSRLREMGW